MHKKLIQVQKEKVKLSAKINFTQYKKSYIYNVEVEPPITHSKIASEIARQMYEDRLKKGLIHSKYQRPSIIAAQMKLVMFLLRKDQANKFEEPKLSDKQQAINNSVLLTKQEPVYKIDCPICNGTGITESDNQCGYTVEKGWPKTPCPKCNSHGYLYSFVAWRAGKTFNNQLVIEVDTHDIHNLALILAHIHKLFKYKFRVVKTGHGYHIIGTHKYGNIIGWLHDNCRLLNPDLKISNLYEYIKQVIDFDNQDKGKLNFSQSEERFKKSSLYHGVGNFDVMFTLLSIKHKKSTLRISKKSPNDKYDLVKRCEWKKITHFN